MSNEITANLNFILQNGNLQFQYTDSFRANQATANGPSPGVVVATTGGVLVSLSQLTLPAMLVIKNIDPTNYVTYGLYDGSTFRPFGELKPGEFNLLRLSRTLLTANAGADQLRLVANTASVSVQVYCFDA